MNSPHPICSVVVCTHNRARTLMDMLDTLRQIRTTEEVDWELIVVDNASTDQTEEVIRRFSREFHGTLRHLFEPTKGKSHALNLAVASARGDYLLFTDDDVRVSPDWIDQTHAAFITHRCAGVAGRIVPDWRTPRPRWHCTAGPYRLAAAIVEYDQGEIPIEVTTRNPPFGANMAFRRDVFARYGGFRTDLGPDGRSPVHGEDTEFCRRILTAGETIVYIPTATIHHPVEPERATKRYFRSFYFHSAKGSVRRGEYPDGVSTFLGIPRYLYRMWAENLLRSQASLDPKRRFYYNLQWHSVRGAMAEFRRRRGAGSSGAASPPTAHPGIASAPSIPAAADPSPLASSEDPR